MRAHHKVDTRNSHSDAWGSLLFSPGVMVHSPSLLGTESLLAFAITANILILPTIRHTRTKAISSNSTAFRFIAVVFCFPARIASRAAHASGKPPVQDWCRQRFGSGQQESESRATLYCVCCLAHGESIKKCKWELLWRAMQRKLQLHWWEALGHRKGATVLTAT